MKNKLKYAVFVLSAAALLSSCNDDNNKGYGNGGATGTSVSLKNSSPVTIGMETDYAAMNDANYLQVAAANASQTTFGSAMTHGAIVQNDGTLNFGTPDAQFAAVSAAGMKVWGRNLLWYQGQNANYIKNFAGLGDPANVMADGNPDFEDWTTNDSNKPIPANWVYANGVNDGSYGSVVQDQAAANVNHGKSSMAVTINQAVTSAGSSWHLQIVSPEFNTVVGHEYIVTYYAKASSASANLQVEWAHNNASPQYGGTNAPADALAYGLTTSWKQYSMTFSGANPKAKDAVTTICFDMAYSPVGTTVWIDNMNIVDKTQADLDADPVNQVAHLNTALENWITGVVSHYKGQVTGWDVVSELLADNGAIRTNANTTSASATDWFVWSNYLGKDAGVKAFTLARAADPNALLFINESGIDGNSATSSQKLDSLIAYVQYLQSQGAPIDGIGVEMHVNIATAKAGVDYMFKKLAATGLKIRISELDVSVNNVRGFSLTPQVLGFQATTYHDVVASYLANVPKTQQQDITIWGVNDPNSWKYNNGSDYPLLFDENYATKPAFDGVLQALKGQ